MLIIYNQNIQNNSIIELTTFIKNVDYDNL